MSPARDVASTYRVQLHSDFGFGDAADVAGYLAELGVSHLYCSPVLQAAPGSTHGYDVVDPQRMSDDLGGAPEYARLVGALRDVGLGQVLDIVPNHMAVDSTNRWWWDVLENGLASRYASFFDIDWRGPTDKAAFTVLVPVLGDHYGRVLDDGGLRVHRRGHDFTVDYEDHSLPISPRTLDDVLSAAARRAGSADLAEIAMGFGALPTSRIADRDAVAQRHARKLELQTALDHLVVAQTDVATAIDAEIDALNDDHDRLDALLLRQNYRLTHWRTASEEIDYRRFFNIESLVGVRIEDPHVFDETHALVLELVREGTVDGLRIDHVDGLRFPARYLARLAEATNGAYTVVEKILEPAETLPATWPVAGTSGYDFLNHVNGLFVESGNEAPMSAIYAELTGEHRSFDEVAYEAKLLVMHDDLAAEVERATELLSDVCADHRRHRDHTRRELREVLREFVAAFPIYRTYVEPGTAPSEADLHHLDLATAAVVDRRPDLDTELVRFVRHLASGATDSASERELCVRLQQLTAPVMAKGVEDTAFYRYYRLVSLNEVGGDPGVFGTSADAFHDAMTAAARDWPATMLTISTHDTKRSADVRARINVLSEIPHRWQRTVARWAELNQRHRGDGPDRNDEYLLYQTLVGAWPVDVERATAFMAKSIREAKVHTSWTNPVPGYDDAVDAFVRAVLGDPAFVTDLERFLRDEQLVERGRRSSLAQTALLLTCPGVADIYQGTELWDLSLVDPDNRRPVDYARRRQLLASVERRDEPVVLGRDECGESKLRLIQRLLQHRRRRPTAGPTIYEPLPVSGERDGDVAAFTRGDLVTVVPLLGDDRWGDTNVGVPNGRWVDLVTGATHDGGRVALDDLFARFPVAVLGREAP